ncbi:MAG: 1-acyl-sn-glycerol-3-phosphate acyltransferase, partial [Terriglobales bacterium]
EKRVKAGKCDDTGAEITKPLSQADSAWLEQPDNQRVLKIIREYSPSHPENLSPLDNLELDLGLDSMRRVELLVALEQELGGDVEESRLADIYTVRDLIDAVRESAASGKKAGKTTSAFAGWGSVLREDPSDPAVLAITKPRPLIDLLLLVVTRAVKVIWTLRAPIQVEGIENIPARAPFLLCSNHQSFLDPVMLLAVIPLRVLMRLFAVGTSEIFGSGFMRHVARILRVVVVDPDANLIPAMRAGAYGLRQDLSLILYPEGERSIDGTPRTFKKGAAILSIHLQVPIVPIAIDGFQEAWPRGKSFQKFARLRIKIGKPIQPPPESQASEDAYAKLTAELKQRVAAMWEELRDKKAEGKSA